MDQYDYFIATHVAESDGPGQALRNYFIDQRQNFVYAACPFSYAAIPTAMASLFQAGVKTREVTGHANAKRGPEYWQWLRDAWFMFRCGWRWCTPQTRWVGINNLNALVGLVLRFFGRCQSVIYYVVDYTPKRFDSVWLNKLYQGIARLAVRHADEIWNLSERMQKVHCETFASPPAKNKLVPIGIDSQAVAVVSEEQIQGHRLVMVSTLFENKGVQLAIEALRFLPEASLYLIGTGPYQPQLVAQAQNLGVGSRVHFLGALPRRQLFQEIAVSRVALAPYLPDENTYTTFADPAKPKEYLACGIPVVITRVPWIAGLIEKTPLGLVIDYDAQQLAAACKKLMTDNVFWHRCRQAALELAKDWTWDKIYGAALKKNDLSGAER